MTDVLLSTLENVLASTLGKPGRYGVRIRYKEPVIIYGAGRKRGKISVRTPLRLKKTPQAVERLQQEFEAATGLEIRGLTAEFDHIEPGEAEATAPVSIRLPSLMRDLISIDYDGGERLVAIAVADGIVRAITDQRFSMTKCWQELMHEAGLPTELLAQAEEEFAEATTRIWGGAISLLLSVKNVTAHQRLAAAARLRAAARPR